VYDRFRPWERDRYFARLWTAGLAEYDELVGIDWEWLSLDGVMTKVPFGGAATGANPTNRGKRCTKPSTLHEGHGLPLAVVVAGANVPDMKLTAPTLDALILSAPAGRAYLRLDNGCEYDFLVTQRRRAACQITLLMSLVYRGRH